VRSLALYWPSKLLAGMATLHATLLERGGHPSFDLAGILFGLAVAERCMGGHGWSVLVDGGS